MLGPLPPPLLCCPPNIIHIMIFTLAGTVDVAYLQHIRACAWYDGCICIYVTRWSNHTYHA